MVGVFDGAVTTGVQRKRIVTELLIDPLQAEAAHRHAASIRYRMTAAKLPVLKEFGAPSPWKGRPSSPPSCAPALAAATSTLSFW